MFNRFFLFLCSVCNHGNEERLMRLGNEMTLSDIAHLALFNLTLETEKKFHDLDTDVVPFLKDHWKYLQPSSEVIFCCGSFLFWSLNIYLLIIVFILDHNAINFRTENTNFGCFLAMQRPVCKTISNFNIDNCWILLFLLDLHAAENRRRSRPCGV